MTMMKAVQISNVLSYTSLTSINSSYNGLKYSNSADASNLFSPVIKYRTSFQFLLEPNDKPDLIKK